MSSQGRHNPAHAVIRKDQFSSQEMLHTITSSHPLFLSLLPTAIFLSWFQLSPTFLQLFRWLGHLLVTFRLHTTLSLQMELKFHYLNTGLHLKPRLLLYVKHWDLHELTYFHKMYKIRSLSSYALFCWTKLKFHKWKCIYRREEHK